MLLFHIRTLYVLRNAWLGRGSGVVKVWFYNWICSSNAG